MELHAQGNRDAFLLEPEDQGPLRQPTSRHIVEAQATFLRVSLADVPLRDAGWMISRVLDLLYDPGARRRRGSSTTTHLPQGRGRPQNRLHPGPGRRWALFGQRTPD